MSGAVLAGGTASLRAIAGAKPDVWGANFRQVGLCLRRAKYKGWAAYLGPRPATPDTAQWQLTDAGQRVAANGHTLDNGGLRLQAAGYTPPTERPDTCRRCRHSGVRLQGGHPRSYCELHRVQVEAMGWCERGEGGHGR